MIVQKVWFLKNVEEIKLSTNLYGESDTPDEIYDFHKKIKITKEYSVLLDISEELCNKYNRAECYALKGDLNKKMFQIEESYLNYNKAISCNPNNAAYYSILGREYFRGSRFYESIETLSYLIEHKNLQNYEYYVSYREFRLIAACCIGDWETAKKDIHYLPNDFVLYTKPVNGIITNEVLLKAINNKQTLKTIE
jgi:tetratricopeptide (TPR) repeat protein